MDIGEWGGNVDTLYCASCQILCGRRSDTGVQEQQGFGSEIPIQPTHEDLLQPMERGRLGHKGWA